jgi:hypothetical protein
LNGKASLLIALKKSEFNYAGTDKGQIATNANIVIAGASLVEDQQRSAAIESFGALVGDFLDSSVV